MRQKMLELNAKAHVRALTLYAGAIAYVRGAGFLRNTRLPFEDKPVDSVGVNKKYTGEPEPE